MSDNKSAIYCTFINRRNGQAITSVPLVNHISINVDITQLVSTFDFDVMFRLNEKIDLKSHDFVEFYYLDSGKKHQILCGFIEDFVKTTSSSSLKFQANGRDFLGQFLDIPFIAPKPIDVTSLVALTTKIIDQTYDIEGDPNGTYIKEYAKIKNRPRTVIDNGAYKSTVIVPELSDSKVGPILQSIADDVITVVYLNRFGQVVLWGRDIDGVDGANVNSSDTGLTLKDVGDTNVLDFTLRENFSKVFSVVKVQIVSGEANLGFYQGSSSVFNTNKKALQIFRPEIRSFQTSTLVTTAGNKAPDTKRLQLAASVMRRSNQNLEKVVIKTSQPYHIGASGIKTPWEVNQLWNIQSKLHGLNEKMKLSGIGYQQQPEGLNVELCFIPKDSLI